MGQEGGDAHHWLRPRGDAHRHVCLPAKVVPVEGDGGVVEQRVLVKVAVEHRYCPSAAFQRCAPDLRSKAGVSGQSSPEMEKSNV